MSPRNLLLALVLLLSAPSALAASVAERSPFAQGLWWNAERSGSGFDIFNVGDYVMVLWYTYDAEGRPTWYSAEGSLAEQASAPLALMRHRWDEGRKAGATQVGSVRVDVRNEERIDLSWTLGAAQGTWTLRPFRQSGVMSEIDHSGTWYQPSHAGWGLSVLEQGDTLGSIVYTYDAAGAPTWVAGFSRDTPSVEIFAYEGACPSCVYRASTPRSVGHLTFDLARDSELALRSDLALPMAAGILVDGARVFQLSRPASTRPADRQLASFPDETSLKAYLAAGHAGGSPGGFSAPPPTPTTAPPTSFSTTNLQEPGVDEADLVKSDGRYIYTYAVENGSRKPVLRIARVGVDGTSLEVSGTYALQSGAQTPIQNAGLFLHGSRLVSIAGTQPSLGWFLPYAWTNGTTHVEVMSLAAPEAPATVWRAEIDGHVLTSRRIGDRLYVVLRFWPSLASPAGTLADYLPKVRISGGPAQPLLEPSAVYSPPHGERGPSADMVVVVAIELPAASGDRPPAARISQSLAVLGTPETVYASSRNLFVATSRYRLAGGGLLPQTYLVLTDLHQVELGDVSMKVAGSGSIEGVLGSDVDKAAFRLSEHGGQLRAVSSSNAWSSTTNKLTVLEPSRVTAGLLKTVAVLPNSRRPQTLGKPGEMLYATRFVGDRLYAVTFKKIDPLYVVDLSQSDDPRIAGELELPGFSDYLHPLPNGLLLGFGKDACPASTGWGDAQFAWFQGLQLSLFDVSNANQPREMQRFVLGRRGSESALLRHHHAFSARQRPDGSMSFAIPARIHDGPFAGCGSYSYAWKESGLLRFELSGRAAAASLTQKATLVTHTAAQYPSGYPPYDSAASDARSILFDGGAVYIGDGQFWRQDSAGNTFGPF